MGEIPKKSKATVLVEYGKPLALWEYPVPEVEPRGILVKVEMAGICGTDGHQWYGKLGIRSRLPTILGHGETLSKIVKLGEGRAQDLAGAPLRVDEWVMWGHVECGECYWCKISHQPTLCANRMVPGINCSDDYPHLLEGFAEFASLTHSGKDDRLTGISNG